jgi:hypothetical protein
MFHSVVRGGLAEGAGTTFDQADWRPAQDRVESPPDALLEVADALYND